eukprot:TRINITY_DN7018_c2_g1_i2.p1 TRINITY_DN7018_c2_g1~~TRINITY_DN7018_c2_g1_i2.p1  ORF type:complete len:133 (+),score=16.54 TRINITY_DN7018_c2_g1_i2:45-443(+)
MPSSVLYWEGLLQTSCFNSTDWSGKKGLLEEKVKVVLEQLLRGEYKSAGLDLKRCGAQRGDYPLYTVKLSRDDCLLFTTVQEKKRPTPSSRVSFFIGGLVVSQLFIFKTFLKFLFLNFYHLELPLLLPLSLP